MESACASGEYALLSFPALCRQAEDQRSICQIANNCSENLIGFYGRLDFCGGDKSWERTPTLITGARFRRLNQAGGSLGDSQTEEKCCGGGNSGRIPGVNSILFWIESNKFSGRDYFVTRPPP